MPPTTEYCALLPIVDDGSIAGCKKLIEASRLTVKDWQAADTYHVTLVFATGVPASDVALLPDAQLPITIKAEAIDQFETPEGYAIHLRVKLTPELAALQRAVYDAFVAQGLTPSKFSNPDDYHPHITLCWATQPLSDPLAIEPFELIAHHVTLSGADHENLAMKRYNNIAELPEDMQQNLSSDEQKRFLDAYNSAFEQTNDEHKSFLAGYGAINRARVMSRKSANGNPGVEGWAMLFTDENHKDSWNTFFTEATNLLEEYYAGAPLWVEHGYDPDYGAAPVGKRIALEIYPRGIWLEHELHPDHPLFERTVADIERGIFSYSSDSIQHYMEQGMTPSGELRNWFLAGCSLVRQPAEPGLGPVTLKQFTSALKAARGREALDDGANPSIVQTITTLSKGLKSMDPETLQNLANMLNVEATPEAVIAAMEALLANLRGDAAAAAPDDAEEVAGVPMKSVREALGLPADTGAKATVAKFAEFIEALLPPEPVTINFGALKTAYEHASNTAKPDPFGFHKDATPPPAKAKPSRKFGMPSTPKVPTAARANVAAALSAMYNAGGKPSGVAMKSLGYTIGANGGWMPDREVSAELIELFYAQTVTMEAGATRVPMDGIETLEYHKIKGGASANYRGMGQAASESQMSFGVVSLNLKELAAATRISNRLLRNSSVALEAVIKNDLEKAMALRADLAHLRGSGAKPSGASGAEPLGVRYTPSVTITTLATDGANPKIVDFVKAWGRIEDANVPLSDTWGIVASPRTLRYMENQRDLTGRKLDDSEWTSGNDTFKTTQVPNNITTGANSDTSEIYLGDWQYLCVGIGADIEFVVSTEKYVAEGETYVQAVMMHDAGVSHPEAFQVLAGVRGTGV